MDGHLSVHKVETHFFPVVIMLLCTFVHRFLCGHNFLKQSSGILFSFLAVLGLHCCTRAFSSYSERRLLSSCSAQVSHCGSFSLGSRARRLQ